MAVVEKECEVHGYPVYVNQEYADWSIFWLSFRHPMWHGIWSPWDGLWFASAFRQCVVYEMMENGNEMSLSDWHSMRVSRLWKLAPLHILAQIRLGMKFQWAKWSERYIKATRAIHRYFTSPDPL